MPGCDNKRGGITMANIEKNEMIGKMGGALMYERFRLRWMQACVKVNKHSRNKELIPEAERRVQDLLIGG